MAKKNPHHLPKIRLPGRTHFVSWYTSADSPPIAEPERDIVVSALKHYADERYKLLAYVVMNDHIHVVVFPVGGYEVEAIVHTWKSFSAHEIQKLRGAKGKVWRRSFISKTVRSIIDLRVKIHKVISNPLKRWPELKEYKWMEWFAW